MPYVYDQSWSEERRRLAGLENLYDPATIAALEATGVSAGWRALEVGGGGGSIAAWLAARGARVVATDLDTRFLEAIEGIEVRTHNVATDDIEPGAYDVIHSRCLLEHLPSRDAVVDKLTAALAPGGWIVLDDYDAAATRDAIPAPVHPPERGELWHRLNDAIFSFMEKAGYDPAFGRRLPFELIARGFEDVGASVRSTLIRGGGPETDFARFTVEQLGPAVVAAGLLTQRDIDEGLEQLSDPDGAAMSIPLVTAWGRKPA